MENMFCLYRCWCEKKFMIMDEVNEKFFMMKYKSWVLECVREGLFIVGGVFVLFS